MSSFGSTLVGRRANTLDITPRFDGYSAVEMIVSDETSYLVGNPDTGRTLIIECPWGTQTIAQNILSDILGYAYQPYTADDASLDPAAELGDGVTVNLVYSGLFSIDKSFGRLMRCHIEAPQDEEIDHEYAFETAESREINRRFTNVESELSIQSDQIAAKVSETGGDNASFGWQLQSDHFSVYSGGTEVFRIDDTGAAVTGEIRATSGTISGFSINGSAIQYGEKQEENSVYVGTDGIYLGKGFSVTSGGFLTCNNIKVNGQNYSASYLGSSFGGGYGFSRAIVQSGGAYPNFFRGGHLVAQSEFNANGSFKFGGYNINRTTITVKDGDGINRSFNVLTYGV